MQDTIDQSRAAFAQPDISAQPRSRGRMAAATDPAGQRSWSNLPARRL